MTAAAVQQGASPGALPTLGLSDFELLLPLVRERRQALLDAPGILPETHQSLADLEAQMRAMLERLARDREPGEAMRTAQVLAQAVAAERLWFLLLLDPDAYDAALVLADRLRVLLAPPQRLQTNEDA